MLKKLKVQNFTVFEELTMDFCKGVDILIGENGTGKTHLLKILYASCTKQDNDGTAFASYFSSDGWAPLKRNDDMNNGAFISLLNDKEEEIAHIDGNASIRSRVFSNNLLKPIFIPAKEMLSHSRGLLALDREREIPFDKTLIDIVSKAQLGETKKITEFQKNLLSSISKVIDGEVIYEKDAFYVKKNNGLKVEFSMEAEGLRKFGLLWKLIRNGLLEENSILLWDEPEANINPQLIPNIVDIILTLQRNNVQVVIATHDYNFAKYFEVKREKEDKVIYHSLFKTVSGVQCAQAENYRDIKNNPIEEANEQLYNDILDKAAVDIENE